MGRKVLCLSIAFACFFSCFALDAKYVYKSLDEDDKTYFLRYFLMKGYVQSSPLDTAMLPGKFTRNLFIPETLLEKFENVKIEPADFATTFFHDFTTKYNLTAEEAFQVARKRCDCKPRNQYLCMPDGTCVPVGDVGGICCT